jgi:hypothetical protein
VGGAPSGAAPAEDEGEPGSEPTPRSPPTADGSNQFVGEATASAFPSALAAGSFGSERVEEGPLARPEEPSGPGATSPLPEPAPPDGVSVTTTAPVGEETGAVVVVRSGAVGGVDEGRVVVGVEWPEPRGDEGEVVLVEGSGPLVVVVVEEEVGVPVSAGAVVVVVADGSVVVVVVEESGAGSAAGVVVAVVDVVVSVPAPGSAPVSARAGEAGRQTTATHNVARARPRWIRLRNTGHLPARTATL